jgi:signal transduction histidine kinase
MLYGVTFLICSGFVLATAYWLMAASLDGLAPVPAKVVASGPANPDGSVTLVDGRTVSAREYDIEARADRERRRAAAAAFRDSVLHALVTRGVLAILAVTPAAWVLCWFAAGRGLRPLHRMTAIARHIASTPTSDGLTARIALVGPQDEVHELADAFDGMLAKLDESFAAQRRFVANAAHELRTPLAIDRTVLEVALDNPATDAATLGHRLLITNQRQALVLDGLLALARAEQATLHMEPVDLAGAVRAALAAADESGLRTELSVEPAVVLGEPALLGLLVRNLVGNAIRYNVPGGWLAVSLVDGGDTVTLTVTNTGEQVPDAAVLFEPFRRGGAPRTDSASGSGLGLSIVRAVTLAHGGDVAASAREQGGLVVIVTLPSNDRR